MERAKKNIIICTTVILVLALAGALFIWNWTKRRTAPEDVVKEEPTPADTVKEYFSLLKDKKYEEMYALLDEDSQKTYDKEYFATRNKNIYEGIEAADIEIRINEDTGEELPPADEEELSSMDGEAVTYAMSMNTVAGKISLENAMSLKKERNSGYRIAWDSTLIFPGLRDDCKVQVRRENGERGALFDIHGEPLAATGAVSEVGFIQEKMNPDTRENDIQKASEILDVSVEYIEGKLSAPYVKADTFVSLKKIDQGDEEKQNQLLQIPGILVIGSVARTYPFGAAAGHLTGYIRGITAEELNNAPGSPLMNRYANIWATGPVFEPIADAIGAGNAQPEELGFGEKMPFELSLPISIYDDGESFVNPVHLLSIYSMLVNEGSMIQPTLRSVVNEPGTVWKDQAISAEAAKTIKDGLIQNVESSGMAESAAKIDGITVFGKVGTTALQSGQEDAKGAECGWFVCGTFDGTLKPIVIVGMVEDIGEKGGNQYLVEKIRDLVEAYSR